ncbi:hypothetical protein BC829DRAFT_394923, partial [Chytridium lagenaria]
MNGLKNPCTPIPPPLRFRRSPSSPSSSSTSFVPPYPYTWTLNTRFTGNLIPAKTSTIVPLTHPVYAKTMLPTPPLLGAATIATLGKHTCFISLTFPSTSLNFFSLIVALTPLVSSTLTL